MKYINYIVKKGDTLSAIADHFDTTVKEIQSANRSEVKDVNKIYVGQVLIIPVRLPSRNYSTIGQQFETALKDVQNLPSVKKLLEMMEG